MGVAVGYIFAPAAFGKNRFGQARKWTCSRLIGHLVWRDQGLFAPFVGHPLQPIPAIRLFLVPRGQPQAVPSTSSIFM